MKIKDIKINHLFSIFIGIGAIYNISRIITILNSSDKSFYEIMGILGINTIAVIIVFLISLGILRIFTKKKLLSKEIILYALLGGITISPMIAGIFQDIITPLRISLLLESFPIFLNIISSSFSTSVPVDVVSRILIAPLAEEIGKGIVFIIIFLLFGLRKYIEVFLLCMMIGFGFWGLEELIYAINASFESVQIAGIGSIIFRSVLMPSIIHGIFLLPFGFAIRYFLQSQKRINHFIILLIGFIASVILHGINNSIGFIPDTNGIPVGLPITLIYIWGITILSLIGLWFISKKQ